MEIDQSNFLDWKAHPVTKKIVERLEALDNDFKEILLNPDIILAERGQIDCAKIVGAREIIRNYLELTVEDLITKEEESDDYRVTDETGYSAPG